MALLKLRNISEETKLGVWKIEESETWFRSQLHLDDRENHLIDLIKNPQRKLHWLSSRLLLRILLNNPVGIIHLTNDKNGMPVVHNYDVKISISHSAKFSALILSKIFDVGIDIEKIDPKIRRIQEKFLSADELKNIAAQDDLAQLFIYWCAKEAMYKLHGRKQLDFRKHLFVNPFKYSNSGKISGSIEKNSFHLDLEITYEKLEDYMMAYTINEKSNSPPSFHHRI